MNKNLVEGYEEEIHEAMSLMNSIMELRLREQNHREYFENQFAEAVNNKEIKGSTVSDRLAIAAATMPSYRTWQNARWERKTAEHELTKRHMAISYYQTMLLKAHDG